MTDHHLVYQHYGSSYHRLVEREDFQGNLLPALERILDLDSLDVIDFGAGTGRLTLLLAPRVKSIQAFDLSPHMLAVAAEQLRDTRYQNWTAAAADHRRIPRQARSADLIISGWSICYLVTWQEHNWQAGLDAAMAEMLRLLRLRGKIIIIETLGTGNEEPVEVEKLKEYYHYLNRKGFQRAWVRTDYQFCSREEAIELVDFFFGREMLAKLGPGEKPVLPECTGIWWIQPGDLV